MFTVLAIVLVLWLLHKLRKIGAREAHLPPGPPAIPLLGNILDFPSQNAHYKFTEWAREYGEVFSLKLGPGTAIVLSSAKAIKELLDKRSNTTSDRPANYLVDQVTGGLNFALIRYGKTWKNLRKIAHAILTPQACDRHLPILVAEANQVMYDLLTSPEKFYTHLQRYSNSIATSFLFGKRSPQYETKEAKDFFHINHLWIKLLTPGAYPPLDLLPFLQYLPERWAPWRIACREVRFLQQRHYLRLVDECEARITAKKENGCYIETLLQRREELEMDREAIAYFGGTLLEAASDTTSIFFQSLILCLVAFPDVQRKAQAEIDSVVGDLRTPSIDDFASLPYIQAVINEVHRFRPVVPLAVPHAALDDEEYNGFVIPKGAIIFGNLWGVYHDPDVFDSPEVFNPDRFLLAEHGTKPGVDAEDFRSTLYFGFGRRICPGIHLANNSMMLNTMNLIWGFDFNLATDPVTGLAIPVDINAYDKGIVTSPLPFQCKISPRNKAKADLIEHEFAESADTFRMFEHHLCDG